MTIDPVSRVSTLPAACVLPLLRSLLVSPLLISTGCSGLQEAADNMADFYAQGNITVQLCSKPGLEGCEFLGSVNVAGPTVKWNTVDLPAAIGDDNLRSMLVVCGRPTTVIAYEHCNFRGRLARFQCAAGSQLEVQHMGALAGKVSSLVFSEAFSDDPNQAPLALLHIPVDLATDADMDSIPEAVALLRSGISGAIAGTPIPGGGGAADCNVLPQCCGSTGSGGGGGSGGIDSATPLSTRVYWTEPQNVFVEAITELTQVDQCSAPVAAEDAGKQLLAVGHSTRLDVDGWAFDYGIDLHWYLEPVLGLGADGVTSGVLRLQPYGWTVWVEDGLLHDRIFDGIGSQMNTAARSLACGILSGIEAAAVSTTGLPGAGEALLTGNQRFTWSFASPVPCNPLAAARGACGDYVATPPTLVMHKE